MILIQWKLVGPITWRPPIDYVYTLGAEGDGCQAFKTFALCITCKKGEGVQIACENVYVTNGRPPNIL